MTFSEPRRLPAAAAVLSLLLAPGAALAQLLTVPAAPIGLEAEPGDQQVTLTWTLATDASIDGYRYQQTAAGDVFASAVEIPSSDASTDSHTITGLTNGTSYTFGLQARNTNGWGLWSAQVVAVPNAPPTGGNSTLDRVEDTPFTFIATHFPFSDADGDTLDHVKITSLPPTGKGTLSLGGTDITSVPFTVTKADLDASRLQYTPPENANGTAFATIGFKVNDGRDDSASAYTVTIDLRAVNDPPVVSGAQAIKYTEDSSVDVATFTAADPDDTTFTWSLSGNDAGDFLIGAGGVLTFTTPPDYDNAADADADNVYEVTVRASDGELTGTLAVTVTIYRQPVWSYGGTDLSSGTVALSIQENDADTAFGFPILNGHPDLTFSVFRRLTVGGVSGGPPLVNDRDLFSATNGPLTHTNDHVYVKLENPPDFENPLDVDEDNVYEITLVVFALGVPGSSTPLTIALTVENVDEAPVANDDDVTASEDTPLEIAVLDNDVVDANAPPLAVTAVGTQTAPGNGTAALEDGSTTTIIYTPHENFNGTDTFSYTVSDGADPPRTATATVTVTVEPVNDPPAAAEDEAETTENVPIDIAVLNNDTDVDAGTTLSVSAVGTPIAPSRGAVAIPEGSTTIVRYTPDADFTGNDTFSYTVSDGTDTATGTVSVTILEGSHNADLAGLTISLAGIIPSGGTLTPAFAAETTEYAVHDVITSDDKARVTPTVADTTATVRVNGVLVTSGSASDDIALEVGSATAIKVEVTAQDRRTVKTYEIVVFSPSDSFALYLQEQIGDDLTWVTRSSGTYVCMGTSGEHGCSGDEYIRFTADATSDVVRFITPSPGTTGFYQVEHVDQGTITNRTTAASTENAFTGSSPDIILETARVNNIWVTVGSQHIVTAVSTCFDATVVLANLTVQAGADEVTLQRASGTTGFVSAATEYTAVVDDDVESLTVTPTLSSASCGQTITVAGRPVSSGTAGDVALARVGATSIPVVFRNGSLVETYHVRVRRSAPSTASNVAGPYFGSTVADRVYRQNDEIEALVLPAARGGDGRPAYALTPELPDGLALDAGTRTISGTPTAPQEETEYTWRATDDRGETTKLKFSITVEADLQPSFEDRVADQVYLQDTEIEPLVLPAPVGGNGLLSHALTPELPDGLALDVATRTISGTPAAAQEETEYTWTATDDDDDTASVTFSITVDSDGQPSFADRVPDQVYTQNSAIDALVLPEASGGNGTLVYRLSPALPAGLALDPATRTISGAPTAAHPATEHAWTATDADGDAASLTFSLTVDRDLQPTFTDDVADQAYTETVATNPLILPEASSGNGTLAYRLSPALPAGLALDPATRTVSGTPTAVQPATEYAWTATDADGDAANVTFSIAVDPDLQPAFADRIADQTYTESSAIDALALPEASGGNGALSYALSPALPPGLALDAQARTIAGTPTAARSATEYAWTATDADGDAAKVAFSIAVRVAAPRVVGSLPPLTLYVGGAGERVDAGAAIAGTGLAWTFESADPSVATVLGDGSAVVVEPGREGVTEVTATATNESGSAQVPLTVTVRTSVAEAMAIRGAFAGQARVLLGSVSDVIGARVGGGARGPARGCGRAGRGAGSGPYGGIAAAQGAGSGPYGGIAAAQGAGSGPYGGAAGPAVGGGAGAHARLRRRAHPVGGGSLTPAAGGPGAYGSGLGGSLGGRSPAGGAGPGRLGPGVGPGSLRGYPGAGGAGLDAGPRGDAGDLLALAWGRSFSVGLGDPGADCGAAPASPAPRWHLWGATDVQWASGGADAGAFDGEWRLLHLGVDRAGERWLGGVSLSRMWGDADYRFADADASGAGRLSSQLTGIHPYFRVELPSGVQLWAIGGLGFGDVENAREHLDGRRDAGDLAMGLAAAGLRKSLSRVGAVELSLVGDAGFVSLSAAGDGSLDGAEALVNRARLGVEMSRRLAGGAEPFAQLYGRHDGGAGPTGGAAEMVLGLRYAGPRLNLEVRGNYLASAADFRQWGGRAHLGYGSTTDASGLAGSLTTQWGARESGGSFLDGHTMQMQMPGTGFGPYRGESLAPEVSGEVGYGLQVWRLRGSLVPTVGYDQGGYGATRARLGLAYRLFGNRQRDFQLRLDTARNQRRETTPYHSIALSAGLSF